MRNLFILILICSGVSVRGQFKISGRVAEEMSKRSVSGASTYLQLVSDTTQVRVTATDTQGRFIFEDVASGSYNLIVQSIGFKKTKLPVLVDGTIDLGEIIAQEALSMLDEVIITTTRTFVESEAGKHTLHVGQDISNAGGTVMDGLAKVPSVETTPQGQITIRGNRSVKIFINGRETKRNSTTLSQIPLELIEKVEVITAPSAKYSAEGTAGIINVIYKRGSDQFLKIASSAFAGLPNRYSGGINLTYRPRRFSCFLDANHNYSEGISKNISNRIYDAQTSKQLAFKSMYRTRFIGSVSSINLGTQFNADSTSSFSFDVTLSSSSSTNPSHQSTTFQKVNSPTQKISLRNYEYEEEVEFAFNLNYQKKYKPGNSIQLNYAVSGEDESGNNRYNTGETDLTDSPITAGVKQSLADERQLEHEARLDFTQPIKNDHTLELGTKLDWIDYVVIQHVELYRPLDNPDVDFDIHQKKLALYALVKRKSKIWSYEAGVRWENFNSASTGKNPDSTFEASRSRLFPSVMVNYSFRGENNKQNIGASYNLRINRPGFFDLYPYISYTDPLNLTSGNPYLQPEIAHAYEFTHQLEFGKTNIQSTLYYRLTQNRIQQTINQVNDSVTLISWGNYAEATTYGFESMITISPAPWFEFIISPTGFINRYGAGGDAVVFNNQLTWRLRLDQEVKISGKWTFQFTEQYRSVTINPRIESQPQYFVNAGIQFKPNQKATLVMNVTDIFNTNQNKFTTIGEGYKVETLRKFQTRRIQVGLRYSFK